MDDIDKKMNQIESIQLFTEVEPDGYPVDKETGLGTPPPKKTHKERTTIVIKFHGDMALHGVSEPHGSAIYDHLRMHLESTAD